MFFFGSIFFLSAIPPLLSLFRVWDVSYYQQWKMIKLFSERILSGS